MVGTRSSTKRKNVAVSAPINKSKETTSPKEGKTQPKATPQKRGTRGNTGKSTTTKKRKTSHNVEDTETETEESEGHDDGASDSCEEDEIVVDAEVKSVDDYLSSPFSLVPLQTLQTYDAMKKYFEFFCARWGKNFIVPNPNGVNVLSKSKFVETFSDLTYVDLSGGESVSFVKRWLKDSKTRAVERLDYIPNNPNEPRNEGDGKIYNFFTSYNLQLKEVDSGRDFVKAWRWLGLQLCECDATKFDFLEQYLAHMLQFPRERPNLAFAFVGAKQGTGKNIFFRPFEHILGARNYLETSIIEQLVDTGKRKHVSGGKLLLVLDEAIHKDTKRYESQIKVLVTGETIKIHQPYEPAYTVSAHHRLIVLSNYIDGLAVDFESGNRRFVLYQPLDTLNRLDGETKSWFEREYVARFVEPRTSFYSISALFTYLMNKKVRFRGADEWGNERHKIMQASVLNKRVPRTPEHARVLYNLMSSDLFGNNFTTGSGTEVRISKPELYSFYLKVTGTMELLSQTKFSQFVRVVLNRGFYREFESEAFPDLNHHIETRTNKERFWLFIPNQVERALIEMYPGLKGNPSQQGQPLSLPKEHSEREAFKQEYFPCIPA